LVGNPEAKQPPRGLGCGLEDYIKTDLNEIGWEGVDMVQLTQYRDQCQALVNMVMNF
jgi:hypothetical protein